MKFVAISVLFVVTAAVNVHSTNHSTKNPSCSMDGADGVSVPLASNTTHSIMSSGEWTFSGAGKLVIADVPCPSAAHEIHELLGNVSSQEGVPGTYAHGGASNSSNIKCKDKCCLKYCCGSTACWSS